MFHWTRVHFSAALVVNEQDVFLTWHSHVTVWNCKVLRSAYDCSTQEQIWVHLTVKTLLLILMILFSDMVTSRYDSYMDQSSQALATCGMIVDLRDGKVNSISSFISLQTGIFHCVLLNMKHNQLEASELGLNSKSRHMVASPSYSQSGLWSETSDSCTVWSLLIFYHHISWFRWNKLENLKQHFIGYNHRFSLSHPEHLDFSLTALCFLCVCVCVILVTYSVQTIWLNSMNKLAVCVFGSDLS